MSLLLIRFALCAALVAMFCAYGVVHAATARATAAPFVVEIGAGEYPFRRGAVFVLPGESLPISSRERIDVNADGGSLEREAPGRWSWRAPDEPGTAVRVELHQPASNTSIYLNAFVLVPFDRLRDGQIEQYRFGRYPDTEAIDFEADYVTPRGFVRVTDENRSLHVTPNFVVGQFLCKQESGWPKFIAPGPRLYERLEQILERVNAHGSNADTLTVMSGYRTPHYNEAIGNVRFSRHLYGDAADIFVDADDDGVMDDLNGDGTSDIADAELLASWIDFPAVPDPDAAVDGGIGLYGPAQWRGPFVHVDTRGAHARWESR